MLGVCREVKLSSTREYYPIAEMMRESLSLWGHEIAHAVAHHSNERMSQEALIQYGQAAATEILGHNQSDSRKAILACRNRHGNQRGNRSPFSRKHEFEADHLGLIFMAMPATTRMRLLLSGPVWQTHQQASNLNFCPLTLLTKNGSPD